MEAEAAAAAPTTMMEGGPADHGEIVGVKVVVRVRKLLGHEEADGCQPCMLVEVEEEACGPRLVVPHLDKAFEFDRAFGPGASQLQVYDETARPLLNPFFKGFNATVLAYGQTGSGKVSGVSEQLSRALLPLSFALVMTCLPYWQNTHARQTHTMGNTLALGQEALDSTGAGIIPRVLHDIFARMDEERRAQPPERRKFRLHLSYLEIYREEARDLLSPHSDTAPAPLSIREDGAGIAVAGLSMHEVASLDAVAALLYKGALARATAATNMNTHSSRSHAVCTLHLESWREAEAEAGKGGNPLRRTLSKFNLVDLAGARLILDLFAPRTETACVSPVSCRVCTTDLTLRPFYHKPRERAGQAHGGGGGSAQGGHRDQQGPLGARERDQRAHGPRPQQRQQQWPRPLP